MTFLSRPWITFLAGALIASAVFGFWLMGARLDTLGVTSFLARFVHVFAAMLWVGLIWFVNFIQLAALEDTDDGGRATLMRHVVPQVATVYRHASNIVLASGIVLLLSNGYLLDRWVFPSAVYIPTFRGVMIWGGVAAATAMWAVVHFVIWPSLRVILDKGAEPGPKAVARQRIRAAARFNLLLAVPVTFVMVAAAHLY